MKSIRDWMKPYLVVKVSSDIVTEHCCQVCVLSMMFCRSVAVCWHGKWLRNQQETPRSTHVDLNCGRPTWDIKKILFTFDFHILLWHKHIGARIISCCISTKKIRRVDPGNRKPSLKLLNCGRKTQNDVLIDTYYRKPELISWWLIKITVFHTRFQFPTD